MQIHQKLCRGKHKYSGHTGSVWSMWALLQRACIPESSSVERRGTDVRTRLYKPCADRRQRWLQRSLEAAWLLELDTFFLERHSQWLDSRTRCKAKWLLQEEDTCAQFNSIYSFCSTTFDHILKIQMKHLGFPMLSLHLFFYSDRLDSLQMVHSDNSSLIITFFFFFPLRLLAQFCTTRRFGWLV